MSDFGDERVLEVPARTARSLCEEAEHFAKFLQPSALEAPERLTLTQLVDKGLEVNFGGDRKADVQVYPSDCIVEMDDREAYTDPIDPETDLVPIVLRKDQFDLLFGGGRMAYRVRSTVGHELCHALLHVPVMWDRMVADYQFSRVRRGTLPAYRDPEWQAWCFAGCLLVPPKVLNEHCNGWTIQRVSDVFAVSTSLVRNHVGRMQRAGLLSSNWSLA